MVLTLERLFNEPELVKAIIDRVMQTRWDTIYWQRYFDFEETKSRTFKTYIGTVTGVVMGSVIDRNSGKPIRSRKALASGFGEVAYLGDRFQMDNDRLDMLKSLIDKFNVTKTADQEQALNDIIEYITDDLRQCLLAPHKRMDYVVGQLRSTGKAKVMVADNPKGIEAMDIKLPVKSITPVAAEKAKFISYLQKQITSLGSTLGQFSVMEMTRQTLNKYVINCPEFGVNYKMIFGSAVLANSGGLMTDNMVNQLFVGIGMPAIRVIEEYVQDSKDKSVNTFEDDRIALLPQDKLGKMMWHEPYEISDPVPTKAYTRSEGGMFISNIRTDEGRFMEYGAEWIPNIANPQKMVNIDLKNLK